MYEKLFLVKQALNTHNKQFPKEIEMIINHKILGALNETQEEATRRITLMKDVKSLSIASHQYGLKTIKIKPHYRFRAATELKNLG